MFKTTVETQPTAQIFIAFAIIDFHKGFSKDFLYESIEKDLLIDIIKNIDLNETFFRRVLVSSTQHRIPLVLFDFSKSAEFQEMMKNSLETIQELAVSLLLDELEILLEDKESLSLSHFLLPNKNRNVKVRSQLIKILSTI